MDDHRQVAGLRNPQMAVEIIALQFDGSMVPIAVQARFAQGHDARMIEQSDDGVPIARHRLGTGIRMDADRGKDRLEGFRNATVARLLAAVVPKAIMASDARRNGTAK